MNELSGPLNMKPRHQIQTSRDVDQLGKHRYQECKNLKSCSLADLILEQFDDLGDESINVNLPELGRLNVQLL